MMKVLWMSHIVLKCEALLRCMLCMMKALYKIKIIIIIIIKFSWPYPSGHRLLHSPSLVAVRLSVGDMASNWVALPFCDWSEDRLGLPSAPLHYGLTWPVGIPTVFQTPVTVPLHCNCLLLGLCKGTVKESTVVSHGRLLHNSLTDST